MQFNKVLSIAVLRLIVLSLTSSMLVSVGLSTQADVDLQKGLAAYWRFDEGEGDIAFDETENHNDGTLICAGKDCSPPKWVEGKIGSALEFDGVDDYVEVADDPSLDISNAITIAAWVRFNVNDMTADGKFVARRGSYDFYFQPSTNRITSWISIGREDHPRPAQVVDWNGIVWHHVGITYSSSAAKYILYIDGENVSSVDRTGSIDSPTANLNLGSYAGIYYHFNGSMDEIRLYNRALPEDEIQKLYQISK